MKHNGPYQKPPSERFWNKVDKQGPDDCWEWTGNRFKQGYGCIFGSNVDGRSKLLKAHRLSWEMANGSIPYGLNILHKCDNPPCVNPNHLYAGTQQQNVLDRALRKRGKEHRQQGSENDNAKLTEEQVLRIKVLLAQGETQMRIAAMFGIKQPQVSRIKLGLSWKHLKDE